MSLSRFKKRKTFQATKKFTDREEPAKTYEKYLDHVIKGNAPFKILVFYGVGGIGKTSLLTQLKKMTDANLSANKSEKVNRILVSFDSCEFSTPMDIFLSIRNQLSIATPLFDYALLKYLTKSGMPIERVKKQFNSDGLGMDIISYCADTCSGGIIPVNLLAKAFNSLKEKYTLNHITYREYINELEDLEAEEIYSRLPCYLGIEIDRAYHNKGINHIFFFDAYESIVKKFQGKGKPDFVEEFIQEFIGSCERGIFVIGSREYIKWGEHNPEWQSHLEQHIIGELTLEDCQYFLKSIPIKEKEVREQIIEVSKGIPLYLDLCVDIYESRKNANKPIVREEFNILTEDIIRRFLWHLNDDEEDLVYHLSILSYFDKDYFMSIIQEFSLAFSSTKFKSLKERSFIIKIDEEEEFYRVNKSIREYIVSTMDDGIKKKVLEFATGYVAQRVQECNRHNQNKILKYFYHLLNELNEYEDIELNTVEKFLRIGMSLVDQGYWKEIGEKLKIKNGNSSKINNAYRFLYAIYLRRTVGVSRALECMRRVEISTDMLGVFSNEAAFHRANIIRISGDYDWAEKEYNRLSRELNDKKEVSRLFIKNQRQYADLLFLRGNFTRALEILKAITNLPENNEIELAETYRIIGHIYRFNWMFDQSRYYYEKALQIGQREKHFGLVGKIYTNLTELSCWNNPDLAREMADRSLYYNSMLDSKIEKGKTYSALAIALTLGGEDKNKIIDAIERSTELQREAGYKSGLLFANIARSIFIKTEKMNQKELAQIMDEINKTIYELRIYSFLLRPLEVLGIKKTSSSECIKWIDETATEKSIKEVRLQRAVLLSR